MLSESYPEPVDLCSFEMALQPAQAQRALLHLERARAASQTAQSQPEESMQARPVLTASRGRQTKCGPEQLSSHTGMAWMQAMATVKACFATY